MELPAKFCKDCNAELLIPKPGGNVAIVPSIDHVIPLAKDGQHSYANIRTACTACNVKKGMKLVNQVPNAVSVLEV